jgi:hypothetical protein
MVAYMFEIVPGHTEKEIKQLFLERFGILLTKGQVKNFKTNHNLTSGTSGGRFQKGQRSWNKGRKLSPEQYKAASGTMFKKGNRPHNTCKIGTEILQDDGYIKVKVAEPNVWKMKHRLVYEQYYGVKLGQNDALIFLDGNRQNCDIDNLLRLKRSELIRYNRVEHTKNPEINMTTALTAKLENKISEKEKERHERTES